VLNISYSKVGLFFFWRLSDLVLLCGARRLPTVSFVKPSRWWSGESGITGETFFNKRLLL
jgi:hypothetical protein